MTLRKLWNDYCLWSILQDHDYDSHDKLKANMSRRDYDDLLDLSLNHKDFLVRELADDAANYSMEVFCRMAKQGDKRAVGKLIDILENSGYSLVRSRAIRALGHLLGVDSPEYVRALAIYKLKEEEEAVALAKRKAERASRIAAAANGTCTSTSYNYSGGGEYWGGPADEKLNYPDE